MTWLFEELQITDTVLGDGRTEQLLSLLMASEIASEAPPLALGSSFIMGAATEHLKHHRSALRHPPKLVSSIVRMLF